MSLRPPQSNLNAVLRVGHGTGTPAEQILGILNMDPEVLFTVRGMLRLLQMCQVGRRMSDFLKCTDKDAWMSLYEKADARIQATGFMRSREFRRVLMSFAEAKRVSVSMDDHAAAVYFKKLLTKHILYFALFDPVAFGLPSDGVVFNMMWFESQIRTFLGRSNGSLTNIVKMIELDLNRVRRNGDFPPVPADFFVSAIRLVAEVTDMDGARRFYQKGRGRLTELENYILQKPFY